MVPTPNTPEHQKFLDECVAVYEKDRAKMDADKTNPKSLMTMPTDATARKNIPLVSGVLDYFPAALAEVAKLSKIGNDKHNPGQPLHHARGKSTDHADCIGRHMIDRGIIDPDTGLDHMVEVCWRSLALLQEIMESRGAPLARGAKLPFSVKAENKLDFTIPVTEVSGFDDKLFQKWYDVLLKEMEKEYLHDAGPEFQPAPKRRRTRRGQVKADHHGRGRKARK